MVLNLDAALRSAPARAGRAWSQAITAVSIARFSVVLRGSSCSPCWNAEASTPRTGPHRHPRRRPTPPDRPGLIPVRPDT